MVAIRINVNVNKRRELRKCKYSEMVAVEVISVFYLKETYILSVLVIKVQLLLGGSDGKTQF